MPEDFDLSSASADATAHLDGLSEALPDPSEVATPEAPASDTEAPAAPKTYKVKVDGEEVEVPEEELLNGYSRTASFTRRSMALADQRKEFEAQRSNAIAREEQINQFFRNPNNIARYYEELTGQKLTPAQAQAIAQNAPPAPASPNGDEFATNQSVQAIAAREAEAKARQLGEEVQEQIARQMAETQRWTQQQIQNARIEADQQRKAVEYHGEITGTIKSLMEKYPVLGAVEDIENVMCLDAQRLDPSTLEEAKAALLNVAKGRAEKLTAHFTQMQKQSAVQRATLNKGIEPPGGSGIAPTPTHFKLGDKGLSDAAADWLDKHSKAK